LEQVAVLVATHPEAPPAASAAVAAARQIREQDLQLAPDGSASLRHGVAKDRRISVEDAHMRHGRKSRSTLVDGYKRMCSAIWTAAWSRRSASRQPMCPRPR
jgi:hypothetical protein